MATSQTPRMLLARCNLASRCLLERRSYATAAAKTMTVKPAVKSTVTKKTVATKANATASTVKKTAATNASTKKAAEVTTPETSKVSEPTATPIVVKTSSKTAAKSKDKPTPIASATTTKKTTTPVAKTTPSAPKPRVVTKPVKPAATRAARPAATTAKTSTATSSTASTTKPAARATTAKASTPPPAQRNAENPAIRSAASSPDATTKRTDGTVESVKIRPADEAQLAKMAAMRVAEKREAELRSARQNRAPDTTRLKDPKTEYQKRYKELRWRWTVLVVGIPFAIVLSWKLYERLVLGVEQKEWPPSSNSGSIAGSKGEELEKTLE